MLRSPDVPGDRRRSSFPRPSGTLGQRPRGRTPSGPQDGREDHPRSRRKLSRRASSASKKHHRPLREVFIHGKARFTEDEWRGFRDGAEDVEFLSAIQIQRSKDAKLYRDKTPQSEGKFNLLRGTALITGPHTAYLWTSGFVPRLQTYAGWEVPNSYRIGIKWGDVDMETVLRDVLGLTKLNFNACIYGDGQPVTLRSAAAVGVILAAGHSFLKLWALPFKFYI